jgi:glucose/mannose-6-phosphate isomerase
MVKLDRSLDKGDMLGTLAKLPFLIKEAWELGKEVKLEVPKDFVIIGMGGSAIGGELLEVLLESKYNIKVVRGYSIPPAKFMIASSYSGNTEETLSAFEEARTSGYKLLAITSNGKLWGKAKAFNIPLIKIPQGYQPRAALPYLFFSLLRVIAPEYEREIPNLCEFLHLQYQNFKPSSMVNPPLKLAQEIYLSDKIPIIYGSGLYSPVARRFKTQLNENSKCLAYWDSFPEMNHNDTVGWSGDKHKERYLPILLRYKGENSRIRKRIELTKELLWKRQKLIEIWSRGETHLQQLYWGIYFLDYASVYLALLRGIDPTPVEIIAKLKEALAKE